MVVAVVAVVAVVVMRIFPAAAATAVWTRREASGRTKASHGKLKGGREGE